MKHLFLLLAAMCCFQLVSAQGAKNKDKKATPPNNMEVISYVSFTPNTVRATIGNDARLFNTLNGMAAFEWPASTGRTAIFLSAPWIAARYEGDTSVAGIRTAAVQNGNASSEYQPGKTAYNGNGQLIAQDPTLPRFKVYRIVRGDTTSSDYQNWPIADGAPTTAQGRPLVTGTESLWSVCNDLKTPRSFSTNPLGVEMQQYVFAFASGAPGIERTIYVRYRIINRNPRNPNNPNQGSWRNAYIAMFSDADLGNSIDDITGCDSLTAMGYTYNATNNDLVYGAAPPAVGMIYLGGRRGNTPINVNAHVRFENSGNEGDPEGGRPDHVYNFLRGRNKVGGSLGNTPPGSSFMFPGDPETNQGIVEPTNTARDKRNVLSAGPIDVLAQDTIEINYAFVIARGTSNLNSVTALRAAAQSIRSFNSVSSNGFAKRATTYKLMQNYPNPFNPTTVINYELPTNSDVRLEVFDMLGRKVETLVSQRQVAGNYSATLNASQLASGVYFYRLQAGNFTETRKMMLVK
jgi:hypothetical protein